jgi:hypothetical protein
MCELKERSIRIIADYLAHRPIGRIISAISVADDDSLVSIEDRRDGRGHVVQSPDDLELWLESFRQGRCLQPTRGFCDCCGAIHSDHDVDGELFELCTSCQTELTAAGFEEAA